jgi:hypothetical protein
VSVCASLTDPTGEVPQVDECSDQIVRDGLRQETIVTYLSPGMVAGKSVQKCKYGCRKRTKLLWWKLPQKYGHSRHARAMNNVDC